MMQMKVPGSSNGGPESDIIFLQTMMDAPKTLLRKIKATAQYGEIVTSFPF